MRRFFARVLADALAPSLARWTEGREKSILKRGRALSAELKDFAAAIGIKAPETIRVEITDRVPLPLPEQWVSLAQKLGIPLFHPSGMALGRTISALTDDPDLMRHEVVHLLQYQRLGGHGPFMWRYLFECLFFGYFDSPLEKEARGRSTGSPT